MVKGPQNTILEASVPNFSPYFSTISCLCGIINLKYVIFKKYAQGPAKFISKVLSSKAFTPTSSAFAFPALYSFAFFIGANK